MGFAPASPTVLSQDRSRIIVPGRAQMAGNAGKLLAANAAGTGYELVDGGGGGGGGAFPIGMTRLQSASVSQNASGAGREASAGGAWAKDTEYLAPAAAAPPITAVDDSGGFSFDEAGWYVVRWRWLGRFTDPATAPARVRFQLSHDNMFFNAYQHAPVEYPDEGGDTTNKEFASDFVSRPMFMAAGEFMSANWRWTGAQLATDNGHRVVVEITRTGA